MLKKFYWNKKQLIFFLLIWFSLVFSSIAFVFYPVKALPEQFNYGDVSEVIHPKLGTLRVSPNIFANGLPIDVNFTSKDISGYGDIAIGFDKNSVTPKKAFIFNPINRTNHYTYDVDSKYWSDSGFDYNLTFESEDSNFWYNGTLILYSFHGGNESYPDGSWNIDFYQEFGLGDKSSRRIHWYTYTYTEWQEISHKFNVLEDTYFDGLNTWYYLKDVYIAKNKEYRLRLEFDIVPSLDGKRKNKYGILIKPSGISLGTALVQNKVLYIDPWYSDQYGVRIDHEVYNVTGTDADYQIKMFIHNGTGVSSGNHLYFNNSCQDDYGDIFFVSHDGGENVSLPFWLDEYDSDKAIFWYKENGNLATTNQTVSVYCNTTGTSVTASDIDNTFISGNEMESLADFDAEFGKVSGQNRVLDTSTYNRTCIRLPDTSSGSFTLYRSNVGNPKFPTDRDFAYEMYQAAVSSTNFPYGGMRAESSGNAILFQARARGGATTTNALWTSSYVTWPTFEENSMYRWVVIGDNTDAVRDVLNVWSSDGDEYTTDRPYGSNADASKVSMSGVGTTYQGNSYYGSWYVREWNDPEPSHGGYGEFQYAEVITMGDIENLFGGGFNSTDNVWLMWEYNDTAYNVTWYEIENYTGSWVNIGNTTDKFFNVSNIPDGSFRINRVRATCNNSEGILYYGDYSYTNYERVYFEGGSSWLSDAVFINELFWLVIIVQSFLSFGLARFGSGLMFFIGMINIFSGIYYVSEIAVSSFNMWGGVFIAIMGLFMMFSGWKGNS